MGNTMKKKTKKTKKYTKNQKKYLQYKPNKIIQPTVRFTTFGGEPINIEPKYSYIYNGVKGGYSMF